MNLSTTNDLPTTTAATRGSVRSYAWAVFAVMFCLLLSDYMSRQGLNALFPILKVQWHMSDTHLGSISSVVPLTVGVLTLPFSIFADRWGRVKSIALMV